MLIRHFTLVRNVSVQTNLKATLIYCLMIENSLNETLLSSSHCYIPVLCTELKIRNITPRKFYLTLTNVSK